MTTEQERLRRRRSRWALRGALVMAAMSIFFGGLFTSLVAVAASEVPDGAGVGFWAGLLLRSSLLWGLGALPFGAALGFYASMIWRDESA